MTLTFELSDDQAAIVTAAFCGNYGYQATTVDGQPNPVTPEDFTRAKIAQHIQDVATNWQQAQAPPAVTIA